MTLLIIILIILLLGGGGWYGRGRWYGAGVSAFDPMSLIWIILMIALVIWLVRQLGVF